MTHWGEPSEDDAQALVEGVLVWLARLGYLDDDRYAEAKAASLRAKGKPERAVRAQLAAKGVEADHIDRAMDNLAERGDGGDYAAALVFCRRRKIGPYRQSDRAAFRQKDLAALGRAGFGWAVAVKAVDAEPVDLCIR